MHALGRKGWRLQATTRPELEPTSSMSLMDDLNASLCVRGRQRISTTTSDLWATNNTPWPILGHLQRLHNVVATVINSNNINSNKHICFHIDTNVYTLVPLKTNNRTKIRTTPNTVSWCPGPILQQHPTFTPKPSQSKLHRPKHIANSHRPRWATPVNIDSRYKPMWPQNNPQ